MWKVASILVIFVTQSVVAGRNLRRTRQPTPAPQRTRNPNRRRPTTSSSVTTAAPVAPTPAPVAVSNAASAEADAWLTAHNTRRTAFYQQYGKSAKDLKWSETLAASAQGYAESLLELSGCGIKHGYKGNSYGGENLACNWGDDTSMTPEQVLTMWFDQEKNLAFGSNLHFSQVAWRGSKYFGCGVASKTLNDGTGCFIQACRYLAPGNCNVDAGNLISNALQDSSPCTPFCPIEGCF